MSFGITQGARAGLCPHGLPMGACPICSGGGGGVSRFDKNTPRKAGEMTWNQCYAIGQMMKAAQHREDMAKVQQQNALIMQNQMLNSMQKMAAFMNTVKTAVLNFPPIKAAVNVMKSVQNFANKAAQTVLNTIPKFLNDIKGKFIDISDKIAAFFGEEKLAKLKNKDDFLKRIKSKILSFAGIIEESREEEETSEEVKQEEKKIESLNQTKRKLFLINENEEMND